MFKLSHHIGLALPYWKVSGPDTQAAIAPGATVSHPLVPFVYNDIPLGSISPNGWLRREMEVGAAGLGGHLYDFYSFVRDSSWLNGSEEYSELNEAFPYWLNALVPFAYTLDDDRLKAQVHDAVDRVLKHRVSSDGWIGPETGGYRLLWARTPILMAFINLAEANDTYRETLVATMHDFNTLINCMLRNNGTGLVEQTDSVLDSGSYFWLLSRAQDMIMSLQWLYDKHPRGREAVLVENMQLLHHYSYKWEDWFSRRTYVKEDLYNVPQSVTDDNFQFLHGVNAGQALKAAAVIRRFTHNDSLVETAVHGVSWTLKYHGAASGTILADERLDGVNPYYGSELCAAVEVMFSQSYNYRALGKSFFADASELAAFNALPGAMTADWWAHQYVSQPNQPYAMNLSRTPFYNVNSLGQTFGLEPHFPCCTVNHPQGFPKFVQAAYVSFGRNGIVHALLSPTTVTTNVSGGAVKIACQTNYPFEDVLVYDVDTEEDFDFYVRVPTWARSSTLTSTAGKSSHFAALRLQKITLPAGRSKVMYEIDTSVRTVTRANDTVAVYRGQLLYAAYIGSQVESTYPRRFDSRELHPPNYAPPESRDFTMINTTAWNIAIDPSTIVYHPAATQPEVDNIIADLPSPIFADGAPPNYMTVRACLIDWGLFDGSVPGSPAPKASRKCLGEAFDARLVPYASAKLHMAELPTIEL